MKKILLTFCLIIGLVLPFFAQSAAKGNVDQGFLNDFVRRNWTTAEGLPGMTVTTILQDNKGYIYIGTYDGLVRFDGVEFVTYNRILDPKYDFTAVRSIFQDSKGNLWVGHNDEGVTCISQDGTIVKYTTEYGLPHNSVRAICEDNDNNIWFGTASGIFRLIDHVTCDMKISLRIYCITDYRIVVKGQYFVDLDAFCLAFCLGFFLFRILLFCLRYLLNNTHFIFLWCAK